MKNWVSISHVNDRFMATDMNNNDILVSYDGVTWHALTCPICAKYTQDLQLHCKEVNDNNHIILSVHIA